MTAIHIHIIHGVNPWLGTTAVPKVYHARDYHYPLTYLLLDGHFGNGPSLQMAQQCGLHLISKLRCDSALYLPYAGPYQGRGPRRKYGAKLDYKQLPEEFL